jgi:endonuclease/exonuclease/phosphatase (EEP) superfamily protein YafD
MLARGWRKESPVLHRNLPQKSVRRINGRLGRALSLTFLASSALLCLTAFLCYGTRSDRCAAITIIPTWVWLLPGLLLTALGWRRPVRRAALAVVLLWLAYLLLIPEEPRSLARHDRWPSPEWQDARARGQALRVVSLNCAGGTIEAAAEVARYEPDLVLLQETPGPREVERLAQQLFGKDAATLVGLDASIMLRGRLTPVALPRPLFAYFVQAHARLANGIETEVISLRLVPAIVRLDLWKPDCWREQTINRRLRREELQAVARQIAALPRTAPLLLGGDFNAPAGDAIFRLLQPRLRDTFREAGLGWGDTIMNELPLQRIDQVWISDRFRTAAVLARRTQNSDHRLVVCDLFLSSRPAP